MVTSKSKAQYPATSIDRNPYDTAASSCLPYVAVTLTYRNDVVYRLDTAFNTTSPITLGPREERTIYDRLVTLTGNVQKGRYWLQAEGRWWWAPAEGLPTKEIVFITLPTLIMLKLSKPRFSHDMVKVWELINTPMSHI